MNESPTEKELMILEYGEDKAVIERLRLEKLYLLNAIEDINDAIADDVEHDAQQIMATIDKTLAPYNPYEIRRMLPTNHRL